MKYFTFVGNHDKFESGSNGLGAVASIFLEYKDEIEDVFLFITPSANKSVNYENIAEQNASFMRSENSNINIEYVIIPVSNPVDFDIVYPSMLHNVLKIIDDYGIQESPKLVNITSGTPTMTTCWVLLERSGVLLNSKLVQSFETIYARQRGKTTQSVNLNIDDFPQIQAPDAIKRQLTIMTRENQRLTERTRIADLDKEIPDLIGESEKIRELKEQILLDIDGSTNVLIIGERGTGKQVVANAIWSRYRKKEDNQLITFDCGTFSRELVASELFGYKKGAFTGANQDNPGIISKSNGRMLFLDEIGNLPIEGQNTLLRFLGDKEIRKVGSHEIEKVDTQIIAATNKNINDSAFFAQDLKDRFDEVVELPPLKDRKEDIMLLVKHFIGIFSKVNELSVPLILEDKIISKLHDYEWPGNVRELEKWINRICRRFNGGTIKLTDLPKKFITDIVQEGDEYYLPKLPLQITLDDYTSKIIEKARQQSGGNMAEVDRLLKQQSGTERQRQYRIRKTASVMSTL